MKIHLLPRLGAILFLIGAIPSLSQACTIPVFRYALERWQASPYDLLVYHRGPMSMEDRQRLRELEAFAENANLEVTEVDLDQKNGKELQTIWEKHGGKNPLPWVIIRAPESDSKTPPVYAGPLDLAKLKPLIDSPMRQKIVRKLHAGNSAIFLLLESGDKKADAEALQLLEAHLPKMEQLIQLPVLSREGPQLRSEIPLLVSFPILRMTRDQAEEAGFIESLLRCEDDLDKVKGPIVFTVFGRGRVLTALHGKDLKSTELEAVGRFLCGACSCQVKELNPGMDLLFRTRWEALLDVELAPQPRIVNSTPDKR